MSKGHLILPDNWQARGQFFQRIIDNVKRAEQESKSPKPYLTNIDYRGAGHKFRTLCCPECYPSMAAKLGVFASYGKVFEGKCDYCGEVIPEDRE